MKTTLLSKILKCMTITFLSLATSGCLILMLTGPTQFDKPETTPKKVKKPISCPKARAYTMRGFLDVFSTGMNTLSTKISRELPIQATTLSYLEEKKLSTFLIKEYDSGVCRTPIILIGHSYGADEQITVARRLNEAHVPVDLLITLDNTKTQKIPQNVRTFYNINSGKSIMSGVIPWGCPLIAESKHTKMMRVDLVVDKHFKRVNHFNIDKLPEVQSYIIEVIKDTLYKHHSYGIKSNSTDTSS